MSVPKEIFASLVADSVVPSAEFSASGGDSVWDRTLASETGRAAVASRAPRESARLFNALAIGRSGNGANAVRTLLNLVAFCDSKGLRKLRKVSVEEVFGERFAKASFGNRGFVEARLSEIATLKLLRGFGKDRDGKQTRFRFVDVPWIDWDSGTFGFELFPDADFSLIQNRVSHFVP